ncbi:tripartite tricarboxylate transporter permease [Bosea sp. 685]|uniref:tripartite tricarboxylate transporter permease n=1 Tax=Bosea sp. 685 TaxID=3080057 RepID=UPI0039778E86
MALGLVGSIVLAAGSLPRAVATIVHGLLVGIVWADINSSTARYTFGLPKLEDGCLGDDRSPNSSGASSCPCGSAISCCSC